MFIHWDVEERTRSILCRLECFEGTPFYSLQYIISAQIGFESL